MKIKCVPDDFQVDEIIDLPKTPGPFSVYRLTKVSTGTLEAMDEIMRHWNLPREVLAFAGLKDKHALTTQFITIRGGPQRDLETDHLDLAYLGRTHRPVKATDIVANEFTIVMRHMLPEEVERAQQAADEVAQFGVPNYFDDQRFGSLGESREFIGHAWCQENWERTLWLILAEPNFYDRPTELEQKRLLREHWNDWLKCKEVLERSHRRSIITYLCDKPTDFRGALARVRHDLRSLYLSAYQSDLWNGLLDQMLSARCGPEQLMHLKVGRRDLPFFQHLTTDQQQEFHQARLPLPSARHKQLPAEIQNWIDEMLAAEELNFSQLRIRHPKDSFFSKGDRKMVIQPRDLKVIPGNDEMYSGKAKLTCSFVLPRGSYATMIVKRLTAVAGADLSSQLQDEETSAPELGSTAIDDASALPPGDN